MSIDTSRPLRWSLRAFILGAFVVTALATPHAQEQAPTWPREPEAPSAPKPELPYRDWLLLIGEYESAAAPGRPAVHLYVLERDGQLMTIADRGTAVAVDAMTPRPVFTRDAARKATAVTIGRVVYTRLQVGPEGGEQLRVTPIRSVPEVLKESQTLTPPAESGDFLPADLVELTTLEPGIKLDVRYATTNNFLGSVFYAEARAFLQRPAADAVVRVHRKLAALGYGLLVHDGYRPWYVTKTFWETTPPDRKWLVANPNPGSRHNRGAAVDLTLYDLKSGAVIPMPSTYDESTPRAYAFYPGGTSLQRWHRALLRRLMEAEGFAVNPEEWWHFDYKDWRRYAVGNVAFDKIPRRAAGAAGDQAAAVTALPPWRAGLLDLHHIATGRGNATFVVLPDGTTLLVDAGAVVADIPYAEPMPDRSRTTGAWIADYIRQFHPRPDAPTLDYAVVTHFHPDHFGELTPGAATTADGLRVAGMTEVIEALGAGTLIDRGWPSYDYPAPLLTAPSPAARVETNAVAAYKRYLDSRIARGSLTVERVVVGSARQITPRHGPPSPGLEVRAVVANGELWTGTGESTRQTFPPLAGLPESDHPDENMCSIGLRLRYGRFDYFTGGDLPGDPEGAPAWQGVEAALGAVLGPIDVQQVNHHGSIDPATPAFLAALRSRVLIVPAWAPTHPSPDALKRLLNPRYYAGPRDIFTLELREPMTHAIGARVGQLAADHGHVVVRVAPGGATYSVFVLDDRTPERHVLKTFGPYTAS